MYHQKRLANAPGKMKQLFVTIAAIFTTVLHSNCNTPSHFITPNEIRNISSTVYLLDGTSLQGKLVITTNLWGKEFVKLHKEGSSEIVNLQMDDVKGYKVGSSYFDLKEIPTGSGKGFHYSFMERLTPENSRIQLYKHTKKSNIVDKNRPNSTISSEYFIQLPNEKANFVWSIGSKKFHPHFNRKMAKIIDDCPELKQRVLMREKGYEIHDVTYQQEKKEEILLRIIKEYDRCKQ